MRRSRALVWQWPVRLLHWLLVALVSGAWLTRQELGDTHLYFGYAAVAIVALRLLWGGRANPFSLNLYASFSQFVRAAGPTWRYARAVFTGAAPRYIGHNPLGGWMVVALLGCLTALAFTGWLYMTDMFWGYGWLASLHEYLGYALLSLVALHIGGVVFTSWQHRENLVLAMLTGRKDAPGDGDVA